MVNYERFARELERRESAFQPDAAITVETLAQDPKLVREILGQAISDLEGMNRSYCGIQHEWTAANGGHVTEICNEITRHNTLSCAHGSRLPLDATISTLARFGFLFPEEKRQLQGVLAGEALAKADGKAGFLDIILRADAERRKQYAAKAAIQYDMSETEILELDDTKARSITFRAQVAATARISAVYGLILKSLKGAEQGEGLLPERVALFRETFEPGFKKIFP